MSLEVYKTPPDLVFSGNPVIFGVKNTGVITSTTERRCMVGITFNSSINYLVAYITINYNNNSYRLIFGVDIPFKGSLTMLQWVEQIATRLKGNNTLNSLFFVTHYYQTIYFTERTITGNISITKQYLSTQISIITYYTSAQISAVEKYIRVIPTKPKTLILPAPKNATVYDYFGSGIELECLVNITSDSGINGHKTDGSVYIETSVSDLVREKKTGHFDIESLFKLYNISTQFSMLFQDIEGNQSLQSSIFNVIDAKISKVMQADINEMDISLWQYIQNRKMFLTWSPDYKKIDIYHPEILYFIAPVTGDYIVMINEFFANGDTNEHSIASFNMSQYQVAMISAAFLNIRSENLISPLSKFEIWILNTNNEIVIDKRTYYLDYNYQSSPRWWLFKNSFGVYEVIRTTGKGVKSNKIEKTFIEKDLPDLYTHSDRDIEQVNYENNFILELTSGPLTENFAKHFSEFLESEDVYLLNNGKALPVIIYDDSYDIKSDESNLIPIKFKVEGNNLDTDHISLDIELPIPGDFNADFNEGFL